MLNFGNKDFRNLQEQVLKNMDDIQFILEEEGTLNQFGIKVVGQETSIDDLPSVADYKEEHKDWAYGDTYAIGEEEPYTLYVLTRANGTHPNDYWFDIGEFPAVGPQGEQGETGVTPVISNTVTALKFPSSANPTISLHTSGTAEAPTFNWTFGIPQGEKGEQGIQGERGPIGPQGPVGPQGIQGIQGDPGYLFTTIGQVDYEENLPSPFSVGRNSAMYVGVTPPYNVYVIIGEGSNLEWFNLGTVSTQSIPTYIVSGTYAESGTLNSDTLQEINANQNAHAIRIGENVFYYLTPGMYGNSAAGVFDLVEVDLVTGHWTSTVQLVSDTQSSTVLIRDATTNINGWVLTTFNAQSTTLSGYKVKLISDRQVSSGHLTLDRAKVYMKAMTGSEFVPMYDYNAPKQVLFIDSAGTIWKPQYMNVGAGVYNIVLFKISSIGDYGTKLYKKIISYNISVDTITIELISTSNTGISDAEALANDFNNNGIRAIITYLNSPSTLDIYYPAEIEGMHYDDVTGITSIGYIDYKSPNGFRLNNYTPPAAKSVSTVAIIPLPASGY